MELEIEYNGKKLQAVEVDISQVGECNGCFFENMHNCLEHVRCIETGHDGYDRYFIYKEVKEEQK